MSAKQVDEFAKDDVAVFMILASLKEESKVVFGELPVVYDFLEVFQIISMIFRQSMKLSLLST